MNGKLKQLPLFIAPELDRALRALPDRFHARAERMLGRAVGHDRTWLHVVWDAVQAERVTLLRVLRGNQSPREVVARHRAWLALAEAGASLTTIADAFCMHEASVRYGIARQREREAAAAAAAEAVVRYQAGTSA
jgi:hypothetical protein